MEKLSFQFWQYSLWALCLVINALYLPAVFFFLQMGSFYLYKLVLLFSLWVRKPRICPKALNRFILGTRATFHDSFQPPTMPTPATPPVQPCLAHILHSKVVPRVRGLCWPSRNAPGDQWPSSRGEKETLFAKQLSLLIKKHFNKMPFKEKTLGKYYALSRFDRNPTVNSSWANSRENHCEHLLWLSSPS